ncbi:MAG: transketolase [Flavobacteriia bacterium]|nr:transketolase [Flavobacteriia bacterium]
MNFNNDNLKKISNKIRLNLIKSLYAAQSGHPGSSLSIIEILVYLFFISKKKPRIILSKGHAAPALYSLFYEKKIINKKDFFNLRKINSITQGHPDFARLKFVDASTGALGQGLSIAVGYCIASKIKKKKDITYCILGDGELQEGQIWEAVMYIAANKILNLCTIIDYNKFQNELSIYDTLDLGSIKKKFESFGFLAIEINGHNFFSIKNALRNLDDNSRKKPLVIIANTIKGKGISFMENKGEWHSNVINESNYKLAIKELELFNER